jgi:hypothetical protein
MLQKLSPKRKKTHQKLPSKSNKTDQKLSPKWEKAYYKRPPEIGKNSSETVFEKRKVNRIFIPKTGENLTDICLQHQRKLEKYFLSKSAKVLGHFLLRVGEILRFFSPKI